MKKAKNIGIEVKLPSKACEDKHCPFHGKISLRGKILVGQIIKTNVHKTAILEFSRLHFIPKYERYEKRRTKLKVHNPTCINAKKGDKVTVMETKPISKTKNFVIIEVKK